MAKKKVTKKATKKITKKTTGNKRAPKKLVKDSQRREWNECETDLKFEAFNKVYTKAGFKLIERAEADSEDANSPIGGIEYAIYNHASFKNYKVNPRLKTVLVVEYHRNNLTSHRQSLALICDDKSDFWFYLSTEHQRLIRKRHITEQNIISSMRELLEGIKDFVKYGQALKAKKVPPRHFNAMGTAAIWNRIKIHPRLKTVDWEATDTKQLTGDNLAWGLDPSANYLNFLANLACNLLDKKYSTPIHFQFVAKTGEIKKTFMYPIMANKISLQVRKNISQLVQDFFENGKSDLSPVTDSAPTKKKKKEIVKKKGDYLSF